MSSSSYRMSLFPGVFLEFSLSVCASIIFLNRRVLRSEILRCLTKGKGASPSAGETLVRPKRYPCCILFTWKANIHSCCAVFLSRNEKDLPCALLFTVISTRNMNHLIHFYLTASVHVVYRQTAVFSCSLWFDSDTTVANILRQLVKTSTTTCLRETEPFSFDTHSDCCQ